MCNACIVIPELPQVLLNMIDHDMDPQAALDAARFCIQPSHSKDPTVALEEGISAEIISQLRARGHKVEGPVCNIERWLFGKGQIISSRLVQVEGGRAGRVWWAGSDGRADGMAVGY